MQKYVFPAMYGIFESVFSYVDRMREHREKPPFYSFSSQALNIQKSNESDKANAVNDKLQTKR